MDPDAALAKLLDLARQLIDVADREIETNDVDVYSPGEELAQTVLDLNEWIVKGGFLPRSWNWRNT